MRLSPWVSPARPDGSALAVAIPWWRNDVNIEDDLVEEVVRIIGYDAVPTVMLSTPIPYFSPTPAIALRDGIKDLLAAGGMQEVINYTLVSAELLERVTPPDDTAAPMRIANPMSSTHEVLRPTLQPRHSRHTGRQPVQQRRAFPALRGRARFPASQREPARRGGDHCRRDGRAACGRLVACRGQRRWRHGFL